MDLFSLLANLVLFSNIFHSNESSRVKEKTTNYPVYAHQVIDNLKEQVAREYGLWCYGRGGSLPTDIRSLSVDFQSNKEATIEQSRALLVDVVEQFIKIINEHEDIRPFLREYPFTIDRITLALDFKESSEEEIADRIEYVLLVKGKVYYSIRNKKTFKHINVFEEPYIEALRMVSSQR